MNSNDFIENTENFRSDIPIPARKSEKITGLIQKKVKFNPNVEYVDVESYKKFNIIEDKAKDLFKNKKMKKLDSILDEDKICMIF